MSRFLPEPAAALNADKTGVLLINLGTPDRADAAALKPYLRRFLSDQRVVELPKLLWQPLLNGVIIPLRSKESAHNYQKVWLAEGSPLGVYTRRQCEGVRARLPENVCVAYAMTYSSPTVGEALQQMKAQGVGKVLAVALYPQYAGSSSGAALDKVFAELQKQRNQMDIRTVSRFGSDSGYIRALAAQIRRSRQANGSGDMLLFSFHGIPQAQADQGDPYPHECAETARLVAQELGLQEHEYAVAFQSHFGKAKWISPATTELLEELPKRGIRSLDVVCPGFVSDCVETLEEIAIAGKEQFLAGGGETFRHIPCLNDHADWLDALADLCRRNLDGWL